MSKDENFFDIDRLLGRNGKIPFFAAKVPALKWLVGLGFLLMMTVFVLGTNYAISTSQINLAFAQSLFNGLYIIMSAMFYIMFSRTGSRGGELDVSVDTVETYDSYENEAKESAFTILIGFLVCFGMVATMLAINKGLFVISVSSIFSPDTLWGTINGNVIGIAESLFYVIALPRFFYGMLTVHGKNLQTAPFLSIFISSLMFALLHYTSPYFGSSFTSFIPNLLLFNMIGSIWFAITGDILGIVFSHAYNDIINFGLNPIIMLVLVMFLVIAVLMKADGDAFKGVEIAR